MASTGLRSTALDVVYWKSPKVSAVAFAVGLLAFFAIGVLGWSSLGSVCAIISLHLIARLVYYNTVGKRPPTYEGDFFSEEDMKAYVSTLTAHANVAARAVFSLACAEDNTQTLQCAAFLSTVALACRLFGTTGFFFLCFLSAFTMPKVYELKQPEVDAALATVRSKVREVVSAALDRVPAMPSIPKAADLKAEEAEKKKL